MAASSLGEPTKIKTVKALLAEAPDLKFIPSKYIQPPNAIDQIHVPPTASDSIPVIDFSLLTCSDLAKRSKAVHALGKACQDWGFFTLVNHGVPEALMKSVLDGIDDFFNLTEEEKASFWRDYLKVLVHPDFHFPNKPQGFSEVAAEYCKRIREVARELLKAISKGLGLGECYIEKALDVDSSLQVFIANLYPICPQPELALGFQAHSDHGLLTLLIENEVGGLQTQHNGNWVNAKALPNSFLINTGDHLEILSNGKYKSNVLEYFH